MQKSSVNKVIIVGNLGQDPEARFTPQGTAVTNLSIATNESWKNQEGQIQDRTEWHRVVLYGKMAETASEYMKKGSMVYVEGRLRTKEWEDQNQNKRKTTEIMCDNFTMLGRRGDNQSNQSNGPESSTEDDDLPF
tara:strand:- start:540 stop:944 length:405 start_codon:yes stop_codon:yes gene_type:complete